MKKLLLLAALAASSMAVSAQDDVVNMVVNGNFEAPGYVQERAAYNWEGAPDELDLSYLPGWQLSTGGIWNGTICVMSGDDYAGDGDLRPEDDYNYLHFLGYYDNGWTTINAAQIVKNLVPGREYTLDFLLAENQPDGAWGPQAPDYGVSVSEVDGEGAGKLIIEEKNMCESQDFEYFSYKFTAPADGQVYLRFFLGNYYYEGNTKQNGNLWMDLDLVRIYSEEGDEEAPEAGVAGIINDAAPVEYYNLQGVRVNKADAKGLYIRKQGNKSTKVIL
ncbi:MAG: hypothetical protein K2J63_01610 [Muribaculaceae bacterium]|nr:hypothetical protein [Muribaculaceae bacterium]MDE6793985.1 hypothetical protein [Muribaculaceae bacterium]